MKSYSLAASTSNYLLLDFFSDDVLPACLGSFLARAEQTGKVDRGIRTLIALDTFIVHKMDGLYK
jgi:hypothetical protein